MRIVCLLLLFCLCFAGSAMPAEVCRTGSRPVDAYAAPVDQLRTVPAVGFDLAYMRVMFQLHSDVIAMANLELQYTSDLGLQTISKNFVREGTDMNKKLTLWYKQRTGADLAAYCGPSNPGYQRLQNMGRQSLSDEYVRTMLVYLQRSIDAAQLGAYRASTAELKDQAKLVVKVSQIEITALHNWQNNLPMFEP